MVCETTSGFKSISCCLKCFREAGLLALACKNYITQLTQVSTPWHTVMDLHNARDIENRTSERGGILLETFMSSGRGLSHETNLPGTAATKLVIRATSGTSPLQSCIFPTDSLTLLFLLINACSSSGQSDASDFFHDFSKCILMRCEDLGNAA